ncbi:hypothetical protein SCAR479_05227 [Seiridium cardinale]|uniref:Uncharacterized protein n=1 Tax=Seiridium cardinale TaxID=138064 RepID=A0ABR2XWW0_9PEZI
MTTTSTTPHHPHQDASSCYFAAEVHSQGYGWMEPTVIDDDDLMFGGKSLSAWHEEDRQKVSVPEEERRGRQRVSRSPNVSFSTPGEKKKKKKTNSMYSTEQKKH